MNVEKVDWLYQEVHDLLDVSSVGLYEFLDLLNTPGQTLSMDERKQLARRVLERLVREPGVQLKILRWPEWDSHGGMDIDDLSDTAWNGPDENGMYVAVDRAE